MNKTAKTVLYVGGGLAAAGVVYSIIHGSATAPTVPALTGPVTDPNTGQSVQPPPENTARDFNSFNKHLASFRLRHPKRWQNMNLHGLDCSDGLGNWRNRRKWWSQQQANAGYPGGPAEAALPGYGGWGGYGMNPTIPGDFGDAPPPREVITGQPYGGGYAPYGSGGYGTGFPGSFYDGSYGDY